MRRPPPGSGFFLCFALNLLYRPWWGGLALLLWLLRFWLKRLPWFLPLPFLGAWLLAALLVTLFLSWAARTSSEPAPPTANKNPYSAKNEDLFPRK